MADKQEFEHVDMLNRIIEKLETVDPMAWSPSHIQRLPTRYDATSGKFVPYRGVNRMNLMHVEDRMDLDKTYPLWMTYNVAKKLGVNVMKGQKSPTQVVFTNSKPKVALNNPAAFMNTFQSSMTARDRTTMKKVIQASTEGRSLFIDLSMFKRLTGSDSKEEIESWGVLRNVKTLKGFNVFNLAQCEGDELDNIAKQLDVKGEDSDVNFTIEQVNAIIENIASELGAKVKRRSTSGPAYSPSLDEIYLAESGAARHPTGYLKSFIHELCHWTGHESRYEDFNRRKPISIGNGRAEYALEELTVEIAASEVLSHALGVELLGSSSAEESGIDNAPLPYLKSYLSESPKEAEEQLMKALKQGIYISSKVYPHVQTAIDLVRGVEQKVDDTLEMG